MGSWKRDQVGLCFECRHARVVDSRTSRFWLCGLAATDPRFPRYPRLPVRACDGFELRSGAPPEPEGGAPREGQA